MIDLLSPACYTSYINAFLFDRTFCSAAVTIYRRVQSLSHHERTNRMKKQIPPASLAHKLWDEIFKSIVSRMPDQLLPLFLHVFQKQYPKDTPVELLSTEYPVPKKSDPAKLSSVFADIALRVGGKDIYHMECQMDKDDMISIRMIEYDTHIALLYGADCGRDNTLYTLQFPHSVILYLDNNAAVPGRCSCRLRFPDGTDTFYSIPVIKIQNYPLSEIETHHLLLFLPFSLLRFRPRLRAKKNKLTAKELTLFVNKIIIILNNATAQQTITVRQYKDYLNYIRMAAEQIFAHHPDLYKEVSRMLTTILPSYSEMEDEITARVTKQVTIKVTARVTDEVTARVTDEVTGRFQARLKKQESENNRLRALLAAHGIDPGQIQ